MARDLANVRIRATDESRAAFDSFKRQAADAARSVDDVHGKFTGLLATLGVTVSVGAFVALTKGAIDAADRINDLSKSTDISVERLAGLQLAARQSGGDLESIAASINKLSVNMGRDADKFRQLGITAKDPLEAFKQLSDIYVTLEDSQLRAAVGAEALGKSWAGAAPLLAEGGKKIGEMVDRGTQLSGLTTEIARNADDLNDKLAELVGTGGALMRVVGPTIPLLIELADELLESRDGADQLDSSFNILAETLRALVVLGGNVKFTFAGVGTEIGGLAAQLALLHEAQLKALGGNFTGAFSAGRQALAIGDMMRADAERRRAEFDAWEERIISGAYDRGDAGRPHTQGLIDNDVARATEARARAFARQPGAAGREVESPFRAMMKGLLEQEKSLKGELTAVEKLDIELKHTKAEALAKLTDKERDQLKAVAASIDAYKIQQEVSKSAIAAIEAEIKAREELDAVIGGFLSTNAQTIRDMQFETQLIELQRQGLSQFALTQADQIRQQLESNIARETAIELRKLENNYNKTSAQISVDETRTIEERTQAVEELTSAYERQRSALGISVRDKVTAQSSLDQLRANQEEARRFSDDLNRSLTDALLRGFESGKEFGKNFFDTLKNMAQTTVLRPIISFLLSPLTGTLSAMTAGLGIPGLANATGGAGGGLSLLSNAGSLANLFNPGGFFSSGMGALGSSVFGGSGFLADIGASLIGSSSLASTGAFGAGSLAAELAGVSGAGAAGLGMAVPVIGGALAIAGLLGAFGDDDGPAPQNIASGYHQRGRAFGSGAWNTDYMSWTGSLGDVPTGNEANYDRLMNETGQWKAALEEIKRMAAALGADTSGLSSKSWSYDIWPGLEYGQKPNTEMLKLAIAQVTDTIAQELLPNIKDLAQANETAAQTFVRLATEAQQVKIGTAIGLMSGVLKVQDDLSDLWLSDLSPLSATERLNRARGGYETSLAGARGGDLKALSGLSGATRDYLKEARSYYASSPDYTAIFTAAQSSIADLVDDTLSEQAIVLSEMGVSLEKIVENTDNLDERIARRFELAIAALGEKVDAITSAQTSALTGAHQDAADQIADAQRTAAVDAALAQQNAQRAAFQDSQYAMRTD